MSFSPILAHGALGLWDETVFISVIIIFITMMGISWLRSRGLDDEPENPRLPTEVNDQFPLE